MPWIDSDTPLHSCQFPQWQEGDEVRANYSEWACEKCGRVYSLLVGRSGIGEEPNIVWRPSYGWMHITGLVYVDGEVKRG